jgi:hypothetical protein
LEIDVDADAGAILVLDQSSSGGRFRPGTLRVDDAIATARLESEDSLLRVVIPDAGRHAFSVDVEAAGRRSGEVETATIALPLAPVASLQVLPSAAAVGVVCERAAAPGFFTAASRRVDDSSSVNFDVSRSTEVRLARSAATEVSLAALPPTAVSRNDIFWNLDECRLTGVYEIAAGWPLGYRLADRCAALAEFLGSGDDLGEAAADAVRATGASGASLQDGVSLMCRAHGCT